MKLYSFCKTRLFGFFVSNVVLPIFGYRYSNLWDSLQILCDSFSVIIIILMNLGGRQKLLERTDFCKNYVWNSKCLQQQRCFRIIVHKLDRAKGRGGGGKTYSMKKLQYIAAVLHKLVVPEVDNRHLWQRVVCISSLWTRKPYWSKFLS